MPTRPTPESLEGHAFFGSFSKSERRALLAAGVFNELERGAQVFLQEDPGEAMYVIVSGEVEISVATKDGDEVMAILRAGDFFGEGSLLASERRSANAVTIAPSALFALSPAGVAILREKEPVVLAAFYEKLLRVISERLRNTTKRLAKRS